MYVKPLKNEEEEDLDIIKTIYEYCKRVTEKNTAIQVFKYKTALSELEREKIEAVIIKLALRYQIEIIIDTELKEVKEIMTAKQLYYRDCYLTVPKKNSNKVVDEFISIGYSLEDVDIDIFNEYLRKQKRVEAQIFTIN